MNTTPTVNSQFTYRRGLKVETWTITKVTPESVSFEMPKKTPSGITLTAHSGMTLENFQAMITEGRATMIPNHRNH